MTSFNTCMLSVPWDLLENKTNQEVRDWANLPDDVVELIINRLNIAERLHVASSCKSWSLAVRKRSRCYNGLSFGSTCLFVLQRDGACLIDPFYKEKHTLLSPDVECFFNGRILCCREGWMLISASEEETIFFYNPLSKAIILLQNMPIPYACNFSFSHTPTSPECVAIAISASFDDSCGTFTCRRGDKKWVYEGFNYPLEFNLIHSTPIFHKGNFYCLGDNGRLAVFNHIDPKSWTVMKEPESIRSLSHRIYLAEVKDELVWIRANELGDMVHICKLDSSSNKWKECHSLGTKCLYVSKAASIWSDVNEFGRRNGVYFGMIRDDNVLFFSCESQKLHSHADFHDAKEYPDTCCWIQPVYSKPSPEELQWN